LKCETQLALDIACWNAAIAALLYSYSRLLFLKGKGVIAAFARIVVTPVISICCD
jgi:hypothetical protein